MFYSRRSCNSLILLKRTLVRGRADVERTKKMSGTNWVKYIPEIKKRKDWLINQEHKDVYVKSNDGLKLHGILFPKNDSKPIYFPSLLP